MEQNWKLIDEENERQFERDMEAAKKASAAEHTFFTAGQLARRSVKENELLPRRNQDGDFQYTLRQGLKAACHAREDVSAVLQIQLALLHRLDRNRNLLWVAIALLLYVAYRLS